MTSDAERKAIARVMQHLSIRFPDVTPTVVSRVVHDTYHSYGTHPNRESVPLLVEEAARDRLRVIEPGPHL